MGFGYLSAMGFLYVYKALYMTNYVYKALYKTNYVYKALYKTNYVYKALYKTNCVYKALYKTNCVYKALYMTNCVYKALYKTNYVYIYIQSPSESLAQSCTIPLYTIAQTQSTLDTATCKRNGNFQRFSTADLYQFTTETPSE
jgi:hypothetical protein